MNQSYTCNFSQGFTLIELLVVVLIIGILATVAVPQYQKAVEKARWAEIYQAERTIAKAQEAYYLANGQYTTDVSALDITFPGKKATDNSFWTNSYSGNFFSSREGIYGNFIRVKNGKNDYAGPSLVTYYGTSRQCRAQAGTDGDAICLWLTDGAAPATFGTENRYYFPD